jgi:hypothetical protein
MEASNFFWQEKNIYLLGRNFFVDKYKKDSSQFLENKKNMQDLLNYSLDTIKNESRRSRQIYEGEDEFDDEEEVLRKIIPGCLKPFLKVLACTLYVMIQSDKNRRRPPLVNTLLCAFKKNMNLKLYFEEDITVISLQDTIKEITHWIINSSIQLMICTPDLHQLFPTDIKNKFSKVELLAYMTASIFRYDTIIREIEKYRPGVYPEETRLDDWYSCKILDMVKHVKSMIEKCRKYVEFRENKPIELESDQIKVIYDISKMLSTLDEGGFKIDEENIIKSLSPYKEYIVFKRLSKDANYLISKKIYNLSHLSEPAYKKSKIEDMFTIIIYQTIDDMEKQVINWLKYLVNEPYTKCTDIDTNVLNNSGLYPEQMKAIDMIINNRVCVLQGKPGSGKSHTITTFANLYRNLNHQKVCILFLSPTRRASLIVEGMLSINNVPYPFSYTIHKAFLTFQNLDGRDLDDIDTSQMSEYIQHLHQIYFQVRFKDYKFIIILDETSMVSWKHLIMVKYMKPDQFIMIGEEKQLPPVKEPRAFFSITRLVPNHTLISVHRYNDTSLISRSVEYIESADFTNFLNQDITKSYGETIHDYIQSLKVNPFSSIILAYRNNILQYLNPHIQQLFLNDEDEEYKILVSNAVFYRNDKIIGIKNNYNYEIYNGEIYIIKKIPRCISHAHEKCQDFVYIKRAAKKLKSWPEYVEKTKNNVIIKEKEEVRALIRDRLSDDLYTDFILSYIYNREELTCVGQDQNKFTKYYHVAKLIDPNLVKSWKEPEEEDLDLNSIATTIQNITNELTPIVFQQKTLLEKATEFFREFELIIDLALKYTQSVELFTDKDILSMTNDSRYLLFYYILREIDKDMVRFWKEHVSIGLKAENNTTSLKFVPIDLFENNLKLGYAITSHKAQGGEFHTVYVYIDKTPQQTLRFFRTAHTRAKQYCFYFTDPSREGVPVEGLIESRFKSYSINREDKDETILTKFRGGAAFPRFYELLT